MIHSIEESLSKLKQMNPRYEQKRSGESCRIHRLQKVLVANRGEIAKRFFLSLKEEGIPSVAVVTDVDQGQSWYEQADEVVMIGELRNYTDIDTVIAAALMVHANAIYPGYGFLSEEAEFVEKIKETAKAYDIDLIFMGPDSSIMHRVGDKLAARKLAKEQGVPLFEGTPSLPDAKAAQTEAEKIGYPVIVKLSAGGGGKGMMPVFKESGLHLAIDFCQRTGRNLYKNDTFYLEKFIEKPVHMEVQIFNGTAIGIRKCAVQRRNQKVIEEAGDAFLDSHTTLSMLAAAENMARISGYSEGAGAGTVEFLFDPASQKFGFLEMNARLQVEHPVTDLSVGIDLAKWQILYFDEREDEIPYELALKRRFVEKRHSIEARIYAEDPESEYAPAPGKIQDLQLPTFNGLRCDFGFKKGDVILPHYDPMIGKVIVEGTSRSEAITRLERALGELYVKGVLTNVNQLLKVVRHPDFKSGKYTNRLLADYSELESGEPDESEARLAAVFGSIAENARLIQESATAGFMSGDLENTVQALRIKKLAVSFTVKVYSYSYEIDLVQTSLEHFFVFIDGNFAGEVELLPRMEGNEDYLMRFGTHYYPVRIDRKPSFTLLRMPDDHGKIGYYKLNIIPLGGGEKADPPGMARSPFQSTFVAFARDEHLRRDRVTEGSIIKAGDPVIIVSAMKMETTVTAPIDGKIVYLCEDGDLSRLEIGKTPDGLVIGKALTEGEVLFIVEPETEQENQQAKEKSKEKSVKTGEEHPLDLLFQENAVELAQKRPGEFIPFLLTLVKSHFLGFLLNDKNIEQVIHLLTSLDKEHYLKTDNETTQNEIAQIIVFYTSIKKIYSSSLNTNLSFFGELNMYVSMWEDDTYRPSYSFKMVLASLFRAYDLQEWLPKSGADNSRIKLAFFSILRAHEAAQGYTHVIRKLVEIASYFEQPSKKMIIALKRLILQEQTERDDSLATFAGKLLKGLQIPQLNRDVTPIVSRKYIPEYRTHVTDIFSSFEGIDAGEIKEKTQASLKKPEDTLLPEKTPSCIQEELTTNLATLEKKFKVKRLYSPYSSVLFYLLEEKSKEKTKRYLAFSVIEKLSLERDDAGNIKSSEATEVACIKATQLMRAYQQLAPLNRNWVEIFACSESVETDLAGSDPSILNYQNFAKIGSSVLRFFADVAISRTTIHIDAKHPGDGSVERKRLLLSRSQAGLKLDLLMEDDAQNPYFEGDLNAANQRLYERDKWPIDLWAREVFDRGSAMEISIKSIDETTWTNPKTGKEETKPVGGRIYLGTVGEKPAFFYMKDSRISGGASGNLEGLKYVAATWLAYKNGAPLYVWNDGAGANIKEGMISLNRAGQGFMMNSLLGSHPSPEKFKQYTQNCGDPVLKSLFEELEAMKDFIAPQDRKNKHAFLIGVGIGSSTGLDVYGSSQMAIQMMVDTEQSYRVLTGSNVIKSVTGEDLTNYEIGGARVMGKWTGTVDLIAANKLHLMTYIRQIQEIFVEQQNLPAINRIKTKTENEVTSSKAIDVLNSRVIHENVDDGLFLPMKEEFYGSGSAICGFARLGGRTALVMGPRTNFGIRAFAPITKVKELMMIARKTGANQVLIFGKRWYHETITEDDLGIRARSDFLKLLMTKKGARIHIITHRDGLRRVTMNSSADALIYVDNDETNPHEYEVIRKTAHFVVKDMTEAFDIAHKVIALLDPAPGQKGKAPAEKPEIPADTAQPYDMVKNVIERTFDKGSFLEFFEKMNDPASGPSLITGFARLAGESVAIIADQPNIMGGAPDAPGTEKFRIFTEFVERTKLPIMMLSNAPGFVPGTKQERLRIQQIGAESLDANILGQTPVVSVVLNQNYGGRQIHAFSKYLRPGIVYLALKRAVMAVMGATASFDLFMGAKYNELLADGKTKEANDLKQKYISDYNTKAAAENDALDTGILDWVIDDIKELRENLIKGLKEARERVKEAFGA